MSEQEQKGIIKKFIMDNKLRYLTGFIFIAGLNILHVLTPMLTGKIIDSIEYGKNSENTVMIFCLLIVGIAASSLVLRFLSRLLILGSSNMFDMMMKKKLFKKLLSLSMDFFDRTSTGSLMALAINDLNAVNNALGRGVITLSNLIVISFTSIIAMSSTVNLKVTMITFIPMPFLFLVIIKFGKIIKKRFKKVQETFADMSSAIQENISGIRVIKTFLQEEAESNKFEKLNENNYKAKVDLAKVRGLYSPLISFLSSISFAILIFAGGPMVLKGEITIGAFIAATSYVGLIARPIRFAGRLLSMIQQGKASSERLYGLFNEKPLIKDSGLNEMKGIKDFKIEFKNVTFSYPENERAVLKDLSLNISPGKTIALTGPVGSGKSTIVHLLIRLYDININGGVFINGENIKNVPLKTLRKQIAFVPQDNFLFSDSIEYNIGFSTLEKKDDIIRKSAETADMDQTINSLDEGYKALLGEKGVNLSGGQKQRLCIARAVYMDSPVLILDDCFSSLDTNTEKKILNKLKNLRDNKTCIIISHRISTIKDADVIYVIEKGRITEAGTHRELVNNKGYYSKTHKMQLLEDKYSHGGAC